MTILDMVPGLYCMLAWARMELSMLLKTHLVLSSGVPCGPICGFASSVTSRTLQIQLSMMLKFGTKKQCCFLLKMFDLKSKSGHDGISV